jgi:GTPase SAR1 family protein
MLATTPTKPLAGMDQKKGYVFKVLVIGEMYTGKTEIVRRYMDHYFPEPFRSRVNL